MEVKTELQQIHDNLYGLQQQLDNGTNGDQMLKLQYQLDHLEQVIQYMNK